MPKAELVIARTARFDIERLAAFLALVDPGKEAQMLDELERGLSTLREHPEIGRIEYDNVRKFTIRAGQGGCVVRYRYRAGEVVVARIHHSREAGPD